MAVDGDAVGCASFVLAAIPTADRAFLVIEDVEVRLERAIDVFRHFRHAVLLDEREYRGLDRSDPGMEFHHDTSLHLAVLVGRFVFRVGFAKERQRRSVGTGGRFDHMRCESLVGEVVAVRQILAAAAPLRLAIGAELHFERATLLVEFAFHVAAQVEIAAMGNPLQFAELAGR